MKVLLIEDEPAVAGLINRGLTESGMEVSVAPDGSTALRMVSSHVFDVVLLDIMLPGTNGLELCRKMRDNKDFTPVLLLTALGTTENIVAGFDAGCDDYLVKPFKFAELEARIKSLARRRQVSGSELSEVKQFGPLSVDFPGKLVSVNGMSITLTATEFRLLEFFLRNKNKVVSRMEILEKVWGIDFNMGTNVVDVYVNYLRKKLSAGTDEKLIQTIVGMGYMFKTCSHDHTE